MPKRKKIIFIVLPATICLFAFLFTYLALLGENDRISNVIEDFFTDIRRYNYPVTLEHLSRELRSDIGTDKEQFYETCFLLELALLKEFKLLDRGAYSIEARKESLWLPYLRDTTIPVGVSLRKNVPRKLADFLGGGDEKEFVDNLFTIVREDGYWKINSINYTGSAISETFTSLKNEVKLDQYLQKTSEGFRVSSFDVKTDGMTPIENRRISFIIHKVLRYLGEDETNKTDDGGVSLY